MPAPELNPEDIELVARTIAEHAHPKTEWASSWTAESHRDFFRAEARLVLEALAAAGRLIPAGGETREEFAAIRRRGSLNRSEFVLRTSPEAARRTAEVWGPLAYAGQRTVVEWLDGRELIGPWREVDHADS